MKLPEERLKEMEARFEDVERRLAVARPDELRTLGKEHADLKDVVERWRAYRRASDDFAEARALLVGATGEEREYVEQEIAARTAEVADLTRSILDALKTTDPNDARDVIVEIRAGAGGDEAGLFAAELFRMYQRYAENKGWKVEVLSSNESGIGGFKEIALEIKGRGAYSRLKYEAGVHRVQRVPVTESSGRIHTSAVAVNVLPEADEVEVGIEPGDLKVEVYRSSGPGGQSVNTTDSAVRIRHLPSGIAVECQEERSQLQNKAKAMTILRARLLQLHQEEQAKALAEERRAQVRTADRSERIRTYNFHENRVSDHRIGYTVHRLTEILAGDIDDLVNALSANLDGDGGGP